MNIIRRFGGLMFLKSRVKRRREERDKWSLKGGPKIIDCCGGGEDKENHPNV